MKKQDKWLDRAAGLVAHVVYFIVGFVGTLLVEMRMSRYSHWWESFWSFFLLALVVGGVVGIFGPIMYRSVTNQGRGTLDEVRRRGVWWELGRRYGLPGAMPLVSSSGFGQEVGRIFMAMLPVYDSIVGDRGVTGER